jgi:hypothetical protein
MRWRIDRILVRILRRCPEREDDLRFQISDLRFAYPDAVTHLRSEIWDLELL